MKKIVSLYNSIVISKIQRISIRLTVLIMEIMLIDSRQGIIVSLICLFSWIKKSNKMVWVPNRVRRTWITSRNHFVRLNKLNLEPKNTHKLAKVSIIFTENHKWIINRLWVSLWLETPLTANHTRIKFLSRMPQHLNLIINIKMGPSKRSIIIFWVFLKMVHLLLFQGQSLHNIIRVRKNQEKANREKIPKKYNSLGKNKNPSYPKEQKKHKNLWFKKPLQRNTKNKS